MRVVLLESRNLSRSTAVNRDAFDRHQAAQRYRQRRNRAIVLRRNPTPAELVLWEYLREKKCHGWRFLQQVPAGPYILDFYCPALRLVIEVDGAIHLLPDVKAHDAIRQQHLEEELKMVVLRLSNEAVLTLSAEELTTIIAAAAERAEQALPKRGERPPRLWQ